MSEYVKHLVECQCVLNLFKNKTKTVYHKFKVFSEINENDEIKEKYVICNNCDIVHRVYEVCQSEIKWGSENLKSLVTTKEDVKFNLESNNKEKIVLELEKNNIDLCEWEYIEYLIENNKEGKIILNKNEIDNNIVYNILYIKGDNFSIKKEIQQRFI
tara:strand:- start:1323 stop:1796 length:474 start_codon:yes stop_codon:yes gene_type:complete